MKNDCTVPNADSLTIKSNKDVYPITLICHGHQFIEQMEIPSADYIRVKIRGCKYWSRIYLPWVQEISPEGCEESKGN